MATVNTQNTQVENHQSDAMSARRRIKYLRFQVNMKKKDIAKSTNPRLIIMMQKDVISWEAEIARLVKAVPSVLGFRDVVDHHMDKAVQ